MSSAEKEIYNPDSHVLGQFDFIVMALCALTTVIHSASHDGLVLYLFGLGAVILWSHPESFPLNQRI